MKYILLVHHNEEVFGKLGETEQQRMRAESVKLAHQLNSSGQYFDAAPLHPTSTATSVRVRDGKRLVTDGPFAETRNSSADIFSLTRRISTRRSASPREFQGLVSALRNPTADGSRGRDDGLVSATGGTGERQPG